MPEAKKPPPEPKDQDLLQSNPGEQPVVEPEVAKKAPEKPKSKACLEREYAEQKDQCILHVDGRTIQCHVVTVSSKPRPQ